MSGEKSSASERAQAWLRALGRSPRDGHEAVALLVHALLLGHGFRDADVDTEREGSHLRADWGVGGYGGRYRHERSALTFEVRATPLGARLRVTGVHDAAEDDATLDLRVAYYYDVDGANPDWQERLTRVDDAATLVLINIAHKLVPDAAKEGYESQAASTSAGTSADAAAGAGSSSNPTPAPQPGPRPTPPSYEDDPLRVGPVRGGVPMFPGYPGGGGGVPAFGRDDLMPQMPGPPQWGPRGGGGMGGGNLMGPRNFPPHGVGGGVGGVPRPGFPRVPPGARYDPMGPGVPGHPDLDSQGPDFDELLPPGQPRNPRGPGRGGGMGGGGPDNMFL